MRAQGQQIRPLGEQARGVKKKPCGRVMPAAPASARDVTLLVSCPFRLDSRCAVSFLFSLLDRKSLLSDPPSTIPPAPVADLRNDKRVRLSSVRRDGRACGGTGRGKGSRGKAASFGVCLAGEEEDRRHTRVSQRVYSVVQANHDFASQIGVSCFGWTEPHAAHTLSSSFSCCGRAQQDHDPVWLPAVLHPRPARRPS